ncbi:rac serine-threonine kinase [Trypanosoma conorhini]|uniref:Rac serine-threonine kinase n=1 Tax=Trypanosoma conorhini TaxID=83891 RepID=A0A3R7NS73_9TRYP|nr:rac serine-threonine kinase [Trypanosoma conorhini]RNF26246.1 rac serine-threonine kinase [Trypanosoma conorhini]
MHPASGVKGSSSNGGSPTTAAAAAEAAEKNGEVLRRVFPPKCLKCGATFPAPRRNLPPKRWDCPTKGCGGKLWQPDDASQACDVCGAAVARFTRHHCRRCGYLTCAKCLTFRTIFAGWSLTEKQRVCHRCAVPVVPVAMSGWLLKLGQRSAFFGEKLHMRYFELRGTVLLYGKASGGEAAAAAGLTSKPLASDAQRGQRPASDSSGSSGAARGHESGNGSPNNNNGSGCGAQPPMSALTGQIDIVGAKVMDVAIHPNAFCVVGPQLPRGYVLSAPSQAAKAQWVEAIREQVRQAHQRRGDEDFEDDLDSTEQVLYAGAGADKNVNVSMRDFELLTVIGLGSFGRVMRVRHKATGKIYAMKILDKQQVVQHKLVSHTNAEKLILSEISHPFVVRLYYAFQTKRHLILVLEFLCGGELFFHLQRNKRFGEARARFYTAEIGMAVDYIHSKSVLYRDLKPENLVLDREGHVVLTDFGLAKREIADDARTHTFCGTPEYMAPELVRKSGHTTAVDWWSLGAFLYEMVNGLPPFYSTNVATMYEMILHKPLVCPAGFSPELKSLLGRLLEKDPLKRMTSGAEFRAHPFFKGLDFDKLLRREIRPEFVPDVSRSDLRYFDKRFLQESTKIAQLDQPCDPSDPVSRAFAGYDFNVHSPVAAAPAQQTAAEERRDDGDDNLQGGAGGGAGTTHTP